MRHRLFRIVVMGLAAALLGAGPAAAGTINPFGNHVGEDHSRDVHANRYLEGANLTRSDRSRRDFSGADMTDVILEGANLERIDMIGTNLTGANLTNVFAERADFSGADLTGAILTGGDFDLAIFTGATYDAATEFSLGFDPVALGMNLIPEPHTATLLGLGLAALTLAARRRY